MTPATVLLDRSFLEALTERTHPHHLDAAARYRELIDRYERAEVRLRARHDHLDELDVADGLLDAVERIHVAGQFRRQARRLELPFGAGDDVAVTLVVMRRESIGMIATLDPAFDLIDVDRA